MANLSFYTPQNLGTVPAASFAQNGLPALSQGLMQAAQMYRAGKEVDKAASQAASLFGDPTYGQIFRSMGMAALASGESPTPILNSMLSTAITLKRDEQQMVQRERMMNLQFGQSMQLENLRTSNNLQELNARNEFLKNEMPAIQGREAQAQRMGTLSGEAIFQQSPMGQEMLQGKARAAEEQRAADIEKASSIERERTRARLGVQEEFGVLPSKQGALDLPTALEDSGVDMDTPLSDLEFDALEDLEMELITVGESSAEARLAITPRLRAVQAEKRIRSDKKAMRTREPQRARGNAPGDNAPRVSTGGTRYITP